MNKVVTSPRETTVINHKDLMNILGYARSSAYRYLQDIKKEYNIKRVLYSHVKQYFHIP